MDGANNRRSEPVDIIQMNEGTDKLGNLRTIN